MIESVYSGDVVTTEPACVTSPDPTTCALTGPNFGHLLERACHDPHTIEVSSFRQELRLDYHGLISQA